MDVILDILSNTECNANVLTYDTVFFLDKMQFKLVYFYALVEFL